MINQLKKHVAAKALAALQPVLDVDWSNPICQLALSLCIHFHENAHLCVFMLPLALSWCIHFHENAHLCVFMLQLVFSSCIHFHENAHLCFFMLLIALNRFRKVSAASFAWITAGAFFFVASDSILAWNKFFRELDHSHLLIMLTYGLAQYGITKGAVSQLRDVSSKSISTQPEAIG